MVQPEGKTWVTGASPVMTHGGARLGRPRLVNYAGCTIDRMPSGWVYIMSNRPNGTLYVGVTNDLARRAFEHRCGSADSFTRQYHLTRLVYAERHENMLAAIQREKNIKHWPRAWKVRLIGKENPDWDDLYDRLG
jgi:putative endonuclease